MRRMRHRIRREEEKKAKEPGKRRWQGKHKRRTRGGGRAEQKDVYSFFFLETRKR
jgi:hypothetical protein